MEGKNVMGEEEWMSLEEARFQLIRAMLEEFPQLRRRLINHLRRHYAEEMK